MTFTFKKAEPTDDRLMIGMVGANNSGKTASSLMLATGVVLEEKGSVDDGDIIVIDTENRRSAKYSGDFNFILCDFQPPFSPERYLEAYQAAIAQNPKFIIIDSMSHEHEGVGGVLEIHEEFLKQKCGNDYKKRDRMNMVAWGRAKKGRKALIMHGLQRSTIHTILCFRAKEKIAMVKDDKGKQQITNDGWDLIGGSEYGYELDIVFTFPPKAEGRPDWKEKSSRINDLSGELKKLLHGTPQISVETGKAIKRISKVDVSETGFGDTTQEPETPRYINGSQVSKLRDEIINAGITEDEFCQKMGVGKIFDVVDSKFDNAVKGLQTKAKERAA